jgi:hypothetical protein
MGCSHIAAAPLTDGAEDSSCFPFSIVSVLSLVVEIGEAEEASLEIDRAIAVAEGDLIGGGSFTLGLSLDIDGIEE